MQVSREKLQTQGEKDRVDLFAAMPLSEAKRLLFAMAAAGRRQRRNGRGARPRLMFIDIKKAYLSGELSENEVACVTPPEEWALEAQAVVVRHATGGQRLGDRRLFGEVEGHWDGEGGGEPHGVPPSRQGDDARGPWRRLHLPRRMTWRR